jgi:hypothetical protein
MDELTISRMERLDRTEKEWLREYLKFHDQLVRSEQKRASQREMVSRRMAAAAREN